MKDSRNNGIVLVYVVLLLVVGSIIMYSAMSRNLQTYKFSVIDRQIATAASYASNAVTDLMRQLSDNPYKDHYSTESIEIPNAFYEGGFSEITIIPDDNIHTLAIEAAGYYGDKENPQITTNLSAVIKFISDLTTYGTYLDGNFTTSASDVEYRGKMWINGTWSITGSNVSCAGGPVFVKDNVSVGWGKSLTINGDLYYGGSIDSGVTVTGNAYNYFPLGDYPTIDTDFYEAHYNTKFTAADHWYSGYPSSGWGWWQTETDYADLEFISDGTIAVNGGAQTISIPSSGLIIYGENCNIRIRGTVHGKVTIVADTIKVRDGISYANGTHHASNEDSFAALATESMYWYTEEDSAMELHGAYFLDSTSEYIEAEKEGWGSVPLNLYGTRNRGITTRGFSSSTLEFDPYLDRYPPPGLPEKPKLIKFNMK